MSNVVPGYTTHVLTVHWGRVRLPLLKKTVHTLHRLLSQLYLQVNTNIMHAMADDDIWATAPTGMTELEQQDELDFSAALHGNDCVAPPDQSNAATHVAAIQYEAHTDIGHRSSVAVLATAFIESVKVSKYWYRMWAHTSESNIEAHDVS